MQATGALREYVPEPKRSLEIEPLLRARSDDPTERNYIYSSYLKSFRRQHPVCRVPGKIYSENQGKVLDYLMEHSEVLVACFPEDPSELLGYAIFDRRENELLLHYLYARVSNSTIERRLLDAAADGRKLVVLTHPRERFNPLIRMASPKHVIYDPYILQRMMAHG